MEKLIATDPLATARTADGLVDWWTLQELSVRWRISVATLRRDTKRGDRDPRKLRHIVVGASVRVSTAEVLRHETPGRPMTPEQRHLAKEAGSITKPIVPNKKIRNLLQKRRATVRKIKEQVAQKA